MQSLIDLTPLPNDFNSTGDRVNSAGSVSTRRLEAPSDSGDSGSTTICQNAIVLKASTAETLC
jgi:hypothetical protein